MRFSRTRITAVPDLVADALHLDEVADEDVIDLLEELLGPDGQVQPPGGGSAGAADATAETVRTSCRDSDRTEHYDPDIGTRGGWP